MSHDIEHGNLTESDGLHEPKGVGSLTSGATDSGKVYVADGAGSGDWSYLEGEGEVVSTGEAGGSKFLREDGDGTCSWQAGTAEGTAVLSTGETGGTKYLREDGDNTSSWQPLVHPQGWGYYLDNASAQTITTTPSILSINGSGAATETSYLPAGVTNLWDTTGDHVIASALGDSYIMRLDLPITNITGSASILQMELDISGAASPTTVIVTRQISISAGSNKTVSVSFGMFSLATFVTNGAQIFLSTDANTADVTAPAILIQRVSAA
jgi:hypothetical protein